VTDERGGDGAAEATDAGPPLLAVDGLTVAYELWEQLTGRVGGAPASDIVSELVRSRRIASRVGPSFDFLQI